MDSDGFVWTAESMGSRAPRAKGGAVIRSAQSADEMVAVLRERVATLERERSLWEQERALWLLAASSPLVLAASALKLAGRRLVRMLSP